MPSTYPSYSSGPAFKLPFQTHIDTIQLSCTSSAQHSAQLQSTLGTMSGYAQPRAMPLGLPLPIVQDKGSSLCVPLQTGPALAPGSSNAGGN